MGHAMRALQAILNPDEGGGVSRWLARHQLISGGGHTRTHNNKFRERMKDEEELGQVHGQASHRRLFGVRNGVDSSFRLMKNERTSPAQNIQDFVMHVVYLKKST